MTELKRPQFSWQFWLGVVFFVAVVLMIVWGGYSANQMLHNQSKMPVRKIKIGGQLRYIDGSVIQQTLLQGGTLPGLAAVDIADLQQKLMAVPWVKWAAVRKSWPDQLDIYLVEHQPVAYWRDEGLINSEAGLFFVPDISVVGGLPRVDSPRTMIAEALQMLDEMNRLLTGGEQQVTDIVVTERKAWEATLNDDLQLRFGRKDPLGRMKRFRGIYPEVLAAGKGIPAYMDFRYDTGAAVFWPAQLEPKTDG